MIVPTIGRVVWFYPGKQFTGYHDGVNPIPALICRVWSNTMINVAGFDSDGNPFRQTSVFLKQEETDPVPDFGHAEWMLYQKSVAAGEIAPTLHA